jgi:flavin reductase (DIM6/NTAB) family NADH-FMN oxidoreductase RutF
VKKTIELGSHVMFVAEVAAVQVSADFIDSKGTFSIEKSSLLVYAHGQYFSLGRRLGGFGFSVRKGVRQGREKSAR